MYREDDEMLMNIENSHVSFPYALSTCAAPVACIVNLADQSRRGDKSKQQRGGMWWATTQTL